MENVYKFKVNLLRLLSDTHKSATVQLTFNDDGTFNVKFGNLDIDFWYIKSKTYLSTHNRTFTILPQKVMFNPTKLLKDRDLQSQQAAQLTVVLEKYDHLHQATDYLVVHPPIK